MDDLLSENTLVAQTRETDQLLANQLQYQNIPQDIVISQNLQDQQINYVTSSYEKPEVYDLNLATMVVNADLPINLNLRVIALYLPIDEYVIGVLMEQVCKRGWFKDRSKKKKKEKKKGRKDKDLFYNQVTLNVKPDGNQSDKLINMKIFSNGNMGFTGVKDLNDVHQTVLIFLDRVNQLKGEVIYYIPQKEFSNSKNFKKNLQDSKDYLQMISDCSDQLTFDWTEFISSINTKGKNPYPNGLDLPPTMSATLVFSKIVSFFFDQFSVEEIKDNPVFLQLVGKLNQGNVLISEGTNWQENQSFIQHSLLADKFLITDLKFVIQAIIFAQIIEPETNSSQLSKTAVAFYQQYTNHFTIAKLIEEIDRYQRLINTITERFEEEQPDDPQELVIWALKLLDVCHSHPLWTLDQPEIFPILLTRIKDEKLSPLKEELTDLTENYWAEFQIDFNLVLDFYRLLLIHQERETVDFTRQRLILELPAWSNKQGLSFQDNISAKDFYSIDNLSISNINTSFKFNFALDRSKLERIIVQKYHETSCSYDTNYGGVKTTYNCNIDCPIHEDRTDPLIEPEYQDCKCKGVFISIFQVSGLINGARSFRQIYQAYNFIKMVLVNEFENILVTNHRFPDPTDQLPDTVSDDNYVYIKKKYLTANPKNRFIIKELGLSDMVF